MKVCVVCCTCDLPARASVRILFSSMGIWMLLLWTARKDSDHREWWSRACNSIHSGVTKGPTKVSRSLHTISCYSKSVVRNRSIWAAKLACNLRVIEIQIHMRDWMWLAMYAYGTNRCTVSKIWKNIATWICLLIALARAYTVVSHSLICLLWWLVCPRWSGKSLKSGRVVQRRH